MEKLFVSYYRVSTKSQEISHLGLDAQKTIVMNYIHNNGNKLIGEFIETESGGNNFRPELLNAIALAKLHDATLVIAKLDRLSRSVSFIATLMETSINFIACDIPAATPLTLHIFAAMAEFERKRISERVCDALKAKRKREPNWIPGTPANLTNELRTKAHAAISRNARNDIHVKHAFHFIEALRGKGLSFQQIADKLTTEGYETRNGNHNWHGMQVYSIFKRFVEEPK